MSNRPQTPPTACARTVFFAHLGKAPLKLWANSASGNPGHGELPPDLALQAGCGPVEGFWYRVDVKAEAGAGVAVGADEPALGTLVPVVAVEGREVEVWHVGGKTSEAGDAAHDVDADGQVVADAFAFRERGGTF